MANWRWRGSRGPGRLAGPLAAELTAAGADTDAGLLAAAQALLNLADAVGSRVGQYTVHVHGGQGVQVGDHNTQHNSFGVAVSSDEGL
jgi:hypothetical protein